MKYNINFDIELRKNEYKGRYIAIEGIDGSGKTTQVERVAEYFQSLGKDVIKIREPRKEGLIGDIVQKVLTGEQKMSSTALQYLFSTDRALNHEDVVIPSLKKGKIVVSDRCFWSAIVYGILDKKGGEYDYKKTGDFILIAHSILSMYHQFIVPDYTFYLKISLDTAIARISQKADIKSIYEDKEKLGKVIEGYNWLAEKFKDITVIDGEKREEEVTAEIVASIK